MDYSGLTYAKPKPHLLVKRKRAADLKADDAKQRKICHLRSGGRCEVILATFKPEHSEITYARCRRAARHNHHLISGRGKRNVARSLFAAFRLDVCAECHTEITNHVMMPMQPERALEAKTVRYERRR